MNVVFWLFLIIGLVLIWACLSFAFKGIGSIGINLFNDVKRELEDEDQTKNQEEL